MNKILKKLLYKRLYLEFYPLESEDAVTVLISNHRIVLLEQAFFIKSRAEFLFRNKHQKLSDNIGRNWFTGKWYIKNKYRQYRLWQEVSRCKEWIEEIHDIIYHLQRNELIKPEQLNHLLYVNRFK